MNSYAKRGGAARRRFCVICKKPEGGGGNQPPPGVRVLKVVYHLAPANLLHFCWDDQPLFSHLNRIALFTNVAIIIILKRP